MWTECIWHSTERLRVAKYNIILHFRKSIKVVEVLLGLKPQTLPQPFCLEKKLTTFQAFTYWKVQI